MTSAATVAGLLRSPLARAGRPFEIEMKYHAHPSAVGRRSGGAAAVSATIDLDAAWARLWDRDAEARGRLSGEPAPVIRDGLIDDLDAWDEVQWERARERQREQDRQDDARKGRRRAGAGRRRPLVGSNRELGVQQPEALRCEIIDRRVMMAAFDRLPWPLREALVNRRMDHLAVPALLANCERGRRSLPDLVREADETDRWEIAIDAYALFGLDHPEAQLPHPSELFLLGFDRAAEDLIERLEARDADLLAETRLTDAMRVARQDQQQEEPDEERALAEKRLRAEAIAIYKQEVGLS